MRKDKRAPNPPLPDDPEYLKQLIRVMQIKNKKRDVTDRIDKAFNKFRGLDDRVNEGVIDKILQVIQRKKKPRVRRVVGDVPLSPEMKRKYVEAQMRKYGVGGVRESLIEAIVELLENDARANVYQQKTIRASKKNIDPIRRGFMKKQLTSRLRQGASRKDIKRDYKELKNRGVMEAIADDSARIMARRLRHAISDKRSGDAHDIIKHIDYIHNVTGDAAPGELFGTRRLPNYPYHPRHVHTNTGYKQLQMKRADLPAWFLQGAARSQDKK
jgi:hypothetical protein